MREKTCVFIGHRECYGVTLQQIEKELERLINWGITDFYAVVWEALIGGVLGLYTR